MASVLLAHRIGQLVGRDSSRISFVRARDFNVRLMKADSVVLLGSIRANPWEELIQDQLNFRFGFDEATRHSFFTNLKPHRDEQPIYRADGRIRSHQRLYG